LIVVASLTQLRSPLLSPSVGGARLACVRNPDGILVEVIEDDSLDSADRQLAGSHSLPAVESVTLSVATLERVREFWVDVLGLRKDAVTLGSSTSQRDVGEKLPRSILSARLGAWRALELGFRGNSEPWTLLDVVTVVHYNDSQGFSRAASSRTARARPHGIRSNNQQSSKGNTYL
jgi:catechol 2,3-dioxygenase-like lactoylglutathione lyase family enzyme